MSLPLIFLPEAESDVQAAYRWYEEHRQGLGDEFLLSVEAGLHAIERHPALFAVMYKNLRRLLIKRFPYGIFYLVENDKIIVFGILHASRDPDTWKKRTN